MLISRGSNLLRIACRSKEVKTAATNLKLVRLSHHVFYRTLAPPPRYAVIMAEVFGGLAWWWILWHLWHDYGHIIGEFDYPDPSKWTDEELGIPPEDE